jgi:hypothetical protein
LHMELNDVHEESLDGLQSSLTFTGGEYFLVFTDHLARCICAFIIPRD